ncbi:MAG: ankyrin repeat domain-containing protein [Bryobacteraceae bacterium]
MGSPAQTAHPGLFHQSQAHRFTPRFPALQSAPLDSRSESEIEKDLQQPKRYDLDFTKSMSESLPPDEAKRLIALCRAGKLYEVEKWIAEGKSIETSSDFKKTPLSAAMDLGFHSLVELLVQHVTEQATKDKALEFGVSKRRLDMVEMLVDHGAQIRSVDLADVLLCWEPTIIRFFLDNGADVVTGSPFAVAFREKVRTALRPFVEYKKAHPDVAVALQGQADRALRHFAHEGDLKWVSLLMWAGANPRTPGPTIDDRYEDDPECHTTALQEACYTGKLEVLVKLKPNAAQDDLADLLSCAVVSHSSELVHYLFKLGATPNNSPDGGSSALDSCLHHLAMDDIDAFLHNRPASKYAVSGALERIRELVEHGAQWRPEGRWGINYVRQSLLKCEPAVTVEVVKLLARHKACPETTLEELLDTPRMRGHLSELGMKLYSGPSSSRRESKGGSGQ